MPPSQKKSAPAGKPAPRVFRLDDAIAALQAGGLAVYPTETFYALGADPESSAAMARLFAAKGREPGRFIGLIAADAAMAFSLAREVPDNARRIADAFWPGPLTLVLPARAGLAPEIAGPDGVAVRVSSHPVARALAVGLGRPVTATSANLSGEPAAATLAQAREAFGEKVKVYLEGGKMAAAAPSTVVAVAHDSWKIIRPGAISADQIAAVLAWEALK
ncbi:MAG: L-threonylcarbamoyladenylate synthase [Candidatus Binataceae bacterium]